LQEENLKDRDWATFYGLPREGYANDDWLLSSHDRFLKQAKDYLTPNGQVICCIGARAPWKAVYEMFLNNEYTPELIHFGVKKQQQVDKVVEGYARLEKQHAPFTFLNVRLVRQLIGDLQASDDSPEELRRLIMESPNFEQARLTARQAFDICTENQADHEDVLIGHGVYVVVGKPKGATGSA
jgi:hypothetical protein